MPILPFDTTRAISLYFRTIIPVQQKVQPDILMFFFIAGHALAFGLIPWILNINITAVVRGIVGYTFGGIDIGQYQFYPIRLLVCQIIADTDCTTLKSHEVGKRPKIRTRYNQAPHLTQDTNGKVTTSQLDITNESQDARPTLSQQVTTRHK